MVSVVLICLAGGVYLTGSRIALLCLGLPIVHFCLGSRKKALVGLSSGVIGLVGLLVITDRYTWQSYDVERFYVQGKALVAALHHPFGIGAGHAEQFLHYSPHQTYIRVLLEQGILGFVVYSAVLFLVMKNLWYAQTPLQHAIRLAIISLLLSNLVVDTLHWRHAWLWIGIALAEGRRHHTHHISHYAYVPHWWRTTNRSSVS